jgi:hypothetical protein
MPDTHPEDVMPKPLFRLSLAEKPGKHMMERQPRYDVLVNGEPQGELYFNMTGYAGTLPTVHGSRMDIGERGISAFRKEVSALNKEAAEAIERGASDARRVALTWPTTDGSVIFALSRDVMSGTDEVHLLSRRELLQAERIFGSKDVGIGFFSEHGFDRSAAPVVLFEEEDRALAVGMTDIRSRIMDRAEAETHQRYVEHVFKTTDDEVRVIVSRRVMDDFDPEPEYVNRLSLEMARARYGEAMRLSDLQVSDARPAVVGNEARSLLARDFTWFEVDGQQVVDDDPEP